MSIDVSQFHQVFFEESFEGLNAIEMGLLGLSEGTPDGETINAIFRAAHSIKGGAGTFGFSNVTEFTHDLETLLDQIRNGQRDLTTEAINVCLQSVDVLREMLTAVQQSEATDDERIAGVSEQLRNLLNNGSSTETPAQTEVVSESVDEDEVAPAEGWNIQFVPHEGIMLTGNDPLRLIRELSELGEMSVQLNDAKLPAFVDLVPEECYLQWNIKLFGDIAEADIQEIFEWVEGDCDLTLSQLSAAVEPAEQESEISVAEVEMDDVAVVESEVAPEAESEPEIQMAVPETVTAQVKPEPVVATPSPAPQPAKTVAEPVKKNVAADANTSSIRVSTEKVDSLINLVGELVITQAMLSQMGEDFSASQLPKLLDGLEQLERNTRELQESILRIRMLPISFAFNRFPRLVHDLSSKMGKKVELKMTGEQTELDKSVMEKIGDPLVHLVRNSLDHGLETPEQRVAAGKPETGLLHLDAFHQGGNIVIKITDDGAGLNEAKILQKAIDRGLVAENEVLTPDKIHELIFLPGFSTADVVSDISGRGVGMDVVRKNIQSLGGQIEIKSEQGKGSTFSIRLPLTLAIMDGQVIEVSGHKYIVPLISIIESVEIKEGMVKKVAGKGEVCKLREEFIPLLRLSRVFGLKPEIERLEDGLLVIVESDKGKLGLFVDDLLSQQQIVIKSLETNYRNVAGLAGATILGDGMVALILDVSGLMNLLRATSDKNLTSKIEAA